jgi:hypothetical protein
MNDKPLWRDAASALAAFIVIAAFGAYGFVAVGFDAMLGVKVIFPPAWETTMGNLAMAALGFLIGKENKSSTGTSATTSG